MAVVKHGIPIHRYIGASSDTKPTKATHDTPQGSTFYEYDTGLMWITYDGVNWVEKETTVKISPLGGKGVNAATFGKPVLQWLKNNGTESNGRAKWVREWGRYGQWTAKLSPGIQSSGDDYASVSFTVNNMPLADLESIEYIYRMGATELCAPNIAIHVFDPDDTDNRADITLSHTHDDLGKGAGWRKFELLPATDGLFYYGNNIPATTGLTGDNGTSLYTLAEYQADAVFSTYVIGKITIEYGYYTAGYFSPAHVCKIVVNEIDIPLVPSIEEQLDITRDDVAKALRTIPAWTFGDPVLRSGGSGRVGWVKDTSNALGLYQKGASGYLANLYGGAQSGDDWAAIYIPVNERLVSDFGSALWSYYMTNEETMGVNIVIWVHDPTDFDKRAEITQLGGVAELEKTAGWNAHEFGPTDTGMFFYGENTTGTGLVAGTQYTWAQFQADVLFSTWTIYRVSFEYGWEASGTFEDAWVADVELDGQMILLKPQPWDILGREVKSYVKATVGDSTADVVLITPASTKKIKVLSIRMVTISATAADFECYFSVADAMPAAKVIAARNLDTDAVAEEFINYGDNGPEGLVDEVVSMRTSVNITTNGSFTIVYREI